MGLKRCIIHINIIGFAHAVAAIKDPSLHNRPVVVAPHVNRSQILDLSPHAFSFGIRKGMALSHAIRLCPDCLITPPEISLYRRAMHALCKEITPFSPFIEPGFVDGHVFADLSGTSKLFGPGVDVAKRICKSVHTRLGLHPGWAIGANKLVAKVASRVSRTQGECEVISGQEAVFLAPHNLQVLPGTKNDELTSLDDFCINTVKDATNLNLGQLQVLLGNRAPFYHDSCRGIDTLPVGEHHRKKDITAFFSFSEDTNNEIQIREVLTFLGENIAFNLRKQNIVTTHLKLGIEYADTTTIIREVSLQTRTNIDVDILTPIQASLLRIWRKRIRVRSLHLCVDRFQQPGEQLSLFSTQHQTLQRDQKLMDALDTISSQFGLHKIRRGRALRVKAPS